MSFYQYGMSSPARPSPQRYCLSPYHANSHANYQQYTHMYQHSPPTYQQPSPVRPQQASLQGDEIAIVTSAPEIINESGLDNIPLSPPRRRAPLEAPCQIDSGLDDLTFEDMIPLAEACSQDQLPHAALSVLRAVCTLLGDGDDNLSVSLAINKPSFIEQLMGPDMQHASSRATSRARVHLEDVEGSEFPSEFAFSLNILKEWAQGALLWAEYYIENARRRMEDAEFKRIAAARRIEKRSVQSMVTRTIRDAYGEREVTSPQTLVRDVIVQGTPEPPPAEEMLLPHSEYARSLQLSEVHRLASHKEPYPYVVAETLTALSIVLSGVSMKPVYDDVARRRLLKDHPFTALLQNMSVTGLSDDKLSRLQPYIDDERLTMANAAKISPTAEKLLGWVKSIRSAATKS